MKLSGKTLAEIIGGFLFIILLIGGGGAAWFWNAFNAGGGVPLAVGSLTSAGLTQISGELATGSQQATFDAMNIFLGLLTDPFIAGRNGRASVGGGNAVPFAAESGSFAYAAKQAKPRKIKNVLSNSFGFGGTNASVIFTGVN